MGYSSTVKAVYAQESMLQLLQACQGDAGNLGNGWGDRTPGNTYYFFERGRENADGSITGTVYKCIEGAPTCKAIGGVRIDPEGVVVRWPTSSKNNRSMSYQYSQVQYAVKHQLGVVSW